MTTRGSRVLCIAVILSIALTPSPGSGQQPSSQSSPQGESWFGLDKIKHFFIAAFVESVAFSALEAAGASRRASLSGAIGVTAAVSVGREVYGARNGGRFSPRDLVWDAFGAGAATALLVRTQDPER